MRSPYPISRIAAFSVFFLAVVAWVGHAEVHQHDSVKTSHCLLCQIGKGQEVPESPAHKLIEAVQMPEPVIPADDDPRPRLEVFTGPQSPRAPPTDS